ncbi:hypothetical protein Moror_4565 [Moniliophthora roreri MCA 2997]|uniref:Uncharacterized protein n=2 Tax=Moniliophthora roreri TaxID=221103 RepID=V2WZU9_MONRO|nr:hypothetical protein Moror_4565 [Moniliophthora roreri MCA 2997]KAI3595829.1 hypothetical protein WG66_001028 [Moniliophthora roreri]
MVRSILKSKSSNASASRSSRPSPSSCSYSFESFPPPSLSPHVHFPPTPTIVSSTHMTHSSSIYDRAPIEVSPNSCELPERGGRVCGSPDSIHHAPRKPKGSYFHPHAYEACEREQPFDSPVPIELPQLIHDTPSSSSSSESDDSDGYGSPNLPSPLPHPRFASRNTSFPPIPAIHTREETDHALSFLPHPPSQVKDRPRLNRRKTPSSSIQIIKSRENHFREPSLDGCLGGF